MNRKLYVSVLLCVLSTAAGTGCSSALESRRFLVREISAADPAEVLHSAQVILRREFGRVDTDPQRRTIVTQPAEYQTSTDSGTARDLYRGRSTMRRIGHFSTTPRGGGCVVHLRIEVQRQDTRRTETMRQDDYRVSDSPAYTPIERDAATTTEQNTVWTFVKRDYALERALLSELQEQFAAEPAGEPTESAP